MRPRRGAGAESNAAFERFVELRKQDLRRIAAHTRGECRFDDVKHEAWLLAHDLGASGRLDPDLRNPESQQLLLSHLYQKLVRYVEQNMRRAVSLDPLVQDDGENARALLDTLIGDEVHGPLDELLGREVEAARAPEPDVHHSLASAWLHLVRRFGNSMPKVADYLLISLSYAYRCSARARNFAVHQQPAPMLVGNTDFLPGPWRRFRVQRSPVQLAFAFDTPLLL